MFRSRARSGGFGKISGMDSRILCFSLAGEAKPNHGSCRAHKKQTQTGLDVREQGRDDKALGRRYAEPEGASGRGEESEDGILGAQDEARVG